MEFSRIILKAVLQRKEDSPLCIHSSYGHQGQTWARLEPESQNCSQVSQMHEIDQGFRFPGSLPGIESGIAEHKLATMWDTEVAADSFMSCPVMGYTA